MTEANGKLLLEVKDLKKHFPIRKGVFKRTVGHIKAVDGISFAIKRGETLGLVGESGCGKTTTGRLIVRAYTPTAGQILFHDDEGTLEVSALSKPQLAPYRQKVQMVFQDPYSSLNPRLTVLRIVEEPLLCLNPELSRAEREDRVRHLLEVVGLDPRYAERYPHAFSGGQRQRIGIARALAIQPDLIVADESVSALDVSIQAQVINLMEELQDEFGLTFLFIAHDLGVVKHISDRVAVMYVGLMVELAETNDLFRRPRHPYTEALLSAVPQPDPDIKLERMVLAGEVADPANRPPGCPFHPRCPYAQARCRTEEPPLRNIGQNGREHWAACHFAEDLELQGVLQPSKRAGS